MQIDFDGFQRIVDELDGVEVCLSEPAKEKDSGIDLQAGRQVIKGDQALAFVRQRKGLPRGDIDRIARQQQFIGAIVREVLSAGTLLNPVRVNGVVSIATESLTVDEGLQFGDLQELAFRFRNFSAGGVVFTTAPVADINGRRAGQDVVLLDEVAGQQLWDQHPPRRRAADRRRRAGRAAAGGAHRRAVRGAGLGLQRRGRHRPGPPRGRRPGGARLPDRRHPRRPRHLRERHGPSSTDRTARTAPARWPPPSPARPPGSTRRSAARSSWSSAPSYDGAQPVQVTGPAQAPAASPAPVTAATDPCAA